MEYQRHGSGTISLKRGYNSQCSVYGSGTYSYTVTATNTAGSDTETFTITATVTTITGISDRTLNADYSAFTNPSECLWFIYNMEHIRDYGRDDQHAVA